MSKIAEFAKSIHRNSTSAASAPNSVSVELLSARQQYRLADFLNRKDLLALSDQAVIELVEPLLDNADVENKDWKLRFPSLANCPKSVANKLIAELYKLPVVGFSEVTVSHVDSADIEADMMVANAEKLATIREIKATIAIELAQFDKMQIALDAVNAAGVKSPELEMMFGQCGATLADLKRELTAAEKRSVTQSTTPSVPTTSETIVAPVIGIHESATQPGLRFEVYTTKTGQTRIKFV